MKPFTMTNNAGEGPFLAGGTTLVDLMKLNVVQPDHLTDLSARRADLDYIHADEKAVRVGAMTTMADLAANLLIKTEFKAVESALLQAASPQIRNMATIAGNILQRTRCSYFRDVHSPCNKREPGSGCSAIGGDTRSLAILGQSPHCIANYPGDLAIALVALDAELSVRSSDGSVRDMHVDALHRLPGDTPHLETTLLPGELIEAISLPRDRFDHSIYYKVRDRSSYAFALASCAVALRLEEGVIQDIRIVLGGLATRPWRCVHAEDSLLGKHLEIEAIERAARLCLEDATPDQKQKAKVELGRRTVMKALLSVLK
ncbi:MAG: xanthine dehydrogenase family protein subunit M [Pseudomonadota bacterium]